MDEPQMPTQDEVIAKLRADNERLTRVEQAYKEHLTADISSRLSGSVAAVSASPQPTQAQVTTFFLNRYGVDLQSDMWNGQNMVMFALAVCKEFFAAASTSSPLKPLCPNCSGALSFTHNKAITFLSCNGRCKEVFELHSAEDMVKFFGAAPDQEALRKLVTDKEPNGYPLWFNRAVHHCPGCDSEDLCVKHLAMGERDFAGCEQEIELFLASLATKPAAQEQPVENSPCRWCQETIRSYGQQYEHVESRLIACRDSEHHVAEPSPQKGKP